MTDGVFCNICGASRGFCRASPDAVVSNCPFRKVEGWWFYDFRCEFHTYIHPVLGSTYPEFLRTLGVGNKSD